MDLFSLTAESNRGPQERLICTNAEKMRNKTMNEIYALVDDIPLPLFFTW
jgi:hypothetical protein